MSLRERLIKALPIGEHVEVKRPQGVLDDEGILAIGTVLKEWFRANYDPVRHTLPAGVVADNGCATILPKEQIGVRLGIDAANEIRVSIGREMKNEKGTFTKRLSKAIYDRYRASIPSDAMGKIGSLAALHSGGAQSFLVDRTDSFDWRAGDFGDSGSCFFSIDSDRSHIRELMEAEGFFALRIFKNEREGLSRCWAYPKKERVVLFNCYSKCGHNLYTFAHIASSLLGVSYKKIELSNDGEDSGNLYINSGSGIMLAEREHMRDSFDFCINDKSGDDYVECDNCGTELGDDDTYTGNNGESMCIDCLNERWPECDFCNERFRASRVTTVYSGDHVCGPCLRSAIDDGSLFRCEQCNTIHSIERDVFHVNVSDSDLTLGTQVGCISCCSRSDAVEEREAGPVESEESEESV